jgi:tRNA modification GTPase
METIFALSSGRGKTGVSVIRVSGDLAKKSLDVFAISKPIKPRVSELCKLKHNGEVIDNALVLYFQNPNSFTGEDVIEFHVHGSVAVVNNILNILSNIEGYRLAEAGEFSKRAFQNGKMDLVQAEGLADLIEAETTAQAKQAMRAMEGMSSKIYEDWRKRIIEIMAFIEAYIDFPDENIPADLDIQAQNKVQQIIDEIESQIKNDNGERVRLGAVATIIGAPNVGKSSLINFLTKREVAIVSDIAGTTRDYLEAHLNIAGMPLTLIDTAGIRESADVIEQEGVRRALQKAENADFAIVMLDDRMIGLDDEKIKSFIQNENNLVILNKVDLFKTQSSSLRKQGSSDSTCDLNQIKTIDAQLDPCFRRENTEGEGNNLIKISLKENIGTEELMQKLTQKLENIMGNSESSIITRARHKTSLQKSIAGLSGFISARKNNIPIELCAENLRAAAVAIGQITGKIGVEDILDKIFSEFCIGK